MSKEELDLLYWKNKAHQLQQLLDAEKLKNYELRRFFVELRFAAKPVLSKLEKVKGIDK